jgi:replicative DNA helicase
MSENNVLPEYIQEILNSDDGWVVNETKNGSATPVSSDTEYQRARAYLAKVPGACEGQRNQELNGLAYRLAKAFLLAENDFTSLLLDWNRTCSPPLGENEASATIRSAWTGCQRKGEAGSKRSAPSSTNTTNTTNTVKKWQEPIPLFDTSKLPPFPVDALPGWLKSTVEAIAVGTQTPPDLPAGVALAVLALCGAGKVRVRVNEGWWEPLNLFVVTALPPGCRKSTVFSTLTEVLTQWEVEQGRLLRPLISKAKTELEIAKKRLAKLRNEAAKADDAEERAALTREAQAFGESVDTMTETRAPRLFCDDVTAEALAQMIFEQDGRMGVFSAEGDIFAIIAGRYSKDPNFGVFLKGHAGDCLKVNRIQRAAAHIERPALTLGLCVQPKVIEGLGARKEFRGFGLLARFLFSLPLNPLGYRDVDAPAVSAEIITAYDTKIRMLLNLPWGTNAQGQPCAHALHIAANSRCLLRDFRARMEPKLAPGEELEGITDWAGKLAGAAVRIAGGLHLAANLQEPWNKEINSETMAAAIKIGEYYMEHAKAAFGMMAADPTTATALKIIGWINRKECIRFEKRQLIQDLRITAAELLRPLALLVEHDYLHAVESAATTGRKPVGPNIFDVNPYLKNTTI